MKNKLNSGDLVPDVSLKDQNGQLIRLRDFVNSEALVIYFYPKDETPGCTAEACSFRDNYEDFVESGAKVIGISTDSVKSHKRFAERHKLNFTLLSDPEKVAEKAFGVPRTLLGLLPGRVTFVFNGEGKLILTFNSQTQATRHIREALKALRSESAAT